MVSQVRATIVLVPAAGGGAPIAQRILIRHIRRDAFMLAGTEIASSPAARE
jgi:hypothetical protein